MSFARRRIKEIHAFLLAGGDFPSSVILNWISTDKPLVAADGYLRFELGDRLAQQVDGQHRIAGLRSALRVKPELRTMEIPVAIYQSLDTPACADVFLSINEKQRPVPRSSVADLYALASDYMVDAAALRARDLAEVLNTSSESPYFGLVKFATDPKSKFGVPISTMVEHFKPLVDAGGTLVMVGLIELKMQAGCLVNFFSILRDWYGDQWESKKNPFMFAAGFVGAMEFLRLSMLPYCNLTRDYQARHMALAMNLTAENRIERELLSGKQGRASWNEVKRLLDAKMLNQASNAPPRI